MTNEKRESKMRKKNKTRKINNIVIKSFIVIAVLMMLLNVMPSEGAERNTHILNRDVQSRVEKNYKVTKITLHCNMCKLVLK